MCFRRITGAAGSFLTPGPYVASSGFAEPSARAAASNAAQCGQGEARGFAGTLMIRYYPPCPKSKLDAGTEGPSKRP
jgi:hypothetical protein